MPSAAATTTASSAVRTFRPRFRSLVGSVGAGWVIEGGGPKLTRGSSFWSWGFPRWDDGKRSYYAGS
ncbi:hypothetical protein GCM10023323_76560 [Streptomyces thinghirensis]|uniref:Uncharacterized protein n=1 Tax=Streptomyces thinghirensis TaxID=551547 RepID=A0ABP9TGN4_9ACTN